jgi:hypothetical protein
MGTVEIKKLHEEYASKPVLVVHSGKLSESDKLAIKLVNQEFGKSVVVVRRKGKDPEEDVIPRLLASTSVYRGVKEIENFLIELEKMRKLRAG